MKTRNQSSLVLLVSAKLLLLPLFLGRFAQSVSNYSPYHYDFTKAVFTPDGRLLQVEYAAKAVDDYSLPCLILPLKNTTVMAVVAFTPASSVLQRLVVLPSASGSGGSSNDILVAISGVLPDGMALLQKVQDYFRQQAQQLGLSSSSSARSLALYAASLCHQRSMGGGIRPYGARCLVLQKGKRNEPAAAWMTDPSGTMYAVDLTAITEESSSSSSSFPRNHHQNNNNICILVGDPRLARHLTKPTRGLVGAALLRKTLQECVQFLQQQQQQQIAEYRAQVVLWSLETGEMVHVPSAVVQAFVQSNPS